jgi:hypothetical protein
MKGMKYFMENINFIWNQDSIQNITDVTSQKASTKNLQTQNINTQFSDIISNVSSNTATDNIVKNLEQKYNVNISVTLDLNDKDSISKEAFGDSDDNGYNNLVIIPSKLLKQMATDPEKMKYDKFR